MSETETEIREKGEITIPKELRERYRLAAQTKVKLVARVDGILIRPRVEDPVSELSGLAKDVWPSTQTTLELLQALREKKMYNLGSGS